MKIVRIENLLNYSLVEAIIQMQFVLHFEYLILKEATNFLIFWVVHFKVRSSSLKLIVVFSLHLIEPSFVDFDKNI